MGMSISGYIVDKWGWHAPFWIGGILGMIGVILSLFIYEPKDKDIKQASIQMKDLILVMREPLLLRASLLSILAHSIIFTTMFGFIPMYVLQIGFYGNDLSMIVFSFIIPHVLATLFMEKLFVPEIALAEIFIKFFMIVR